MGTEGGNKMKAIFALLCLFFTKRLFIFWLAVKHTDGPDWPFSLSLSDVHGPLSAQVVV